MDNIKFSISMRDLARESGLCDKWYNEWQEDSTMDELLDKFTKGFDFYIEKRWLTPAFIRGNAHADVLREHGVLCNDSHSMTNRDECFLIGESRSNLRYNARYSGTIWLLDNSVAELSVKGNSVVFVHLYDMATIKVNQRDPSSRIVVFLHSSEATVVRDPRVDAEIIYAKDYK